MYGKLTHSVDEGKVDGVPLDFSKSLDAVSQHPGETGCTVGWVKNLAGLSEPEKGVSGATSSWWLGTSGVPQA